MRFIITCFTIGLLIASAIPSIAGCSGLTLIPTADCVGANQYSLDLATDASFKDPNTDSRFLSTEFGLGDRFELGVDFDLSKGSDNDPTMNAKYVFLADSNNGLYIAAGVFATQLHTKPQSFIAATKVLNYGRLHLGGIRIDNNNRWFVGADKALGEKWTVLADYINGDENYSAIGVGYQFSENFGVSAGALFPNIAGDTLYTLSFTLTGSVMHSPPGESAKQ